MIGTLIRQDLTLLRREKAALFAVLLAGAAVCYAVYSASQWKAAATASYQAALSAAQEAQARELGQLEAIASGTLSIAEAASAGLPNTVSTSLLKPPAPLAELSVSDADLHPSSASIKAVGRADDLFRFYQLDNPAMLALGRFDLAFAVVYLLPLLILGLTHNVLSSDRESGSLQLLLSQPVTAARVAWTRIALRTTLVTALVIVCAALSWAAFAPKPGAPDGVARLGLFLTLTGLYALFWACLSGWVVSKNRSSDVNALTLLLIWALLTMLAPAAAAVVAKTISPMPSRLQYITAARQAENEANAQASSLMKGYLLDHPELEATEQSAVAPFIKTFVLVQQQVSQAVEPIALAFEQQKHKQHQVVRRLSYLSPATVTQSALAELAGTSLRLQREFEQQARTLRETWLTQLEPPLMAGQRLTAEAYDALPRPIYHYEPMSAGVRVIAPMAAALLLYSFVLVLLARRRFQRFAATD